MNTNGKRVLTALVMLAAWPVVSHAQTPRVRVPAPVRAGVPINVPAMTVSVQAPQVQMQVPPMTLTVPDLGDALSLDVGALQTSLDALGVMDDMDIWLAASSFAAEQLPQGRPLPRARLAFGVGDESALYEAGLSAIDAEQWQRAVERFDEVIKAGKNRVDGAMYWKAYALDKLGQRGDALSTLGALAKSYPNSRYLDDARALEMEVRKGAGQAVKPEDQANEDLRLMALTSVMQADPERAIPLVEQILKGRNSLKIKERALFVLSTSDSPRAKEALVSLAKGGANPDLQMKAIRYLGMRRSSNASVLADIYAASKDNDVKREIIRSLGMARDADRLVNVAKTEPAAELRIEAIRQLGMMRANDQLMALYSGEKLAEAREQIMRSMIIAGNEDRALQLTRQETDAKVRADAVRNLGTAGKAKTGQALVEIYRTDKDAGVRKAVVDALYMQQNAQALVDLARQETDPAMKRAIVSRLSTMKAKEATDYMLELLK